MIAKNCDGVVPAARRADGRRQGASSTRRAAALEHGARGDGRAGASTRRSRRSSRVVAEANRYFAGQEPWALKKTDPARMETVLWTTAEIVRRVAILCQPFMPDSAAKLLDLLAVPADERDFAHVDAAHALVSGHAAAGAGGRLPALCRTAAQTRRPAEACSSTATAISTFRISPTSATRIVARARAAGVEPHGHDLDARKNAFRKCLRSQRQYRPTSTARSAPIRTMPPRRLDVTADELVRLSAHPKVVAIGEAGLDYHYDKAPRDAAGAGLSHPYRGGAPHRPAAGHPCAQRRRRHGGDPRRGNREGRLPLHPALLFLRPRSSPESASSSAATSPSPAS